MSNAHYATTQNKMSGDSCTIRRQHCIKKHPYHYHRVAKEVKKTTYSTHRTTTVQCVGKKKTLC